MLSKFCCTSHCSRQPVSNNVSTMHLVTLFLMWGQKWEINHFVICLIKYYMHVLYMHTFVRTFIYNQLAIYHNNDVLCVHR